MDDRDGNIRGLRGWNGPESVNVVNWNGISRSSSANGQANARLIAAAPEMLEALEMVMRVGRIDDNIKAMDQVAEVIAKARGL